MESIVDTDPINDSKKYYAILVASSGKGTLSGKLVSLVLRCQKGDSDFYINWESFISKVDDGNYVTYRIGTNEPKVTYGLLSTDSKATFLEPSPVTEFVPFLKSFAEASTFVARITPFQESPITATWDLTGSDVALGDIRKNCNW